MTITDELLDDCSLYDQLYRETAGTATEFMQLSRGAINFLTRTVELDGLSLLWLRSHGRVRWRDVKENRAWHFGVIVDSEATVTACGRELPANSANVFIPGQESEFMMRGPYTTLEIALDTALVEELGWSPSGEQLRQVPNQELDHLITVCRQASSGQANQSWSSSDKELRKARVLEALEPVLSPWRVSCSGDSTALANGSRSFKVLSRADAFFDSFGESEPIEIEHLANSLGIARRTLFRAFRETLGIGPYQYFELKRLHILKARLREADHCSTSVTAIALQLGFMELGRLAGKYKNLFGEYPSDTLKRS